MGSDALKDALNGSTEPKEKHRLLSVKATAFSFPQRWIPTEHFLCGHCVKQQPPRTPSPFIPDRVCLDGFVGERAARGGPRVPGRAWPAVEPDADAGDGRGAGPRQPRHARRGPPPSGPLPRPPSAPSHHILRGKQVSVFLNGLDPGSDPRSFDLGVGGGMIPVGTQIWLMGKGRQDWQGWACSVRCKGMAPPHAEATHR